jgi:hypothetical protein
LILKLCKKRVTTAIFSVTIPPVFDKRDVRKGLDADIGLIEDKPCHLPYGGEFVGAF